MEGDQDMFPSWGQTKPGLRPVNRRLRRCQSFLLNSGSIFIIIIVVSLAVYCVIIPSLLSFISRVLRPPSLKKGWESLNILLILFTIACGLFLSKNSDETSAGVSYQDKPALKVQGTKASSAPKRTKSGRMRSSSTPPDLRQKTLLFRFSDDTQVSVFRRRSYHECLREYWEIEHQMLAMEKRVQEGGVNGERYIKEVRRLARKQFYQIATMLNFGGFHQI